VWSTLLILMMLMVLLMLLMLMLVLWSGILWLEYVAPQLLNHASRVGSRSRKTAPRSRTCQMEACDGKALPSINGTLSFRAWSDDSRTLCADTFEAARRSAKAIKHRKLPRIKMAGR
jgi:hypothetical protein